MKKSLSLLLAIAMVFSMFASVASAADEMTAEQKYDALEAKGIFAGIDGDKALDQDMTRAQFARVVSLLMELDLNNPPATASFSDVQPGHWAFEEVEAVHHAELMSGYSETVFGDKDNITIEQMARVYVDALGLAVDEEAEVEGASEWAQKYVEAAVDAGLIAADADFTANAIRAQLATVSYEVAAKVGVLEPEQVSVVSAEPTGVKEVTVTLDKTVETADIEFTVERNSASVDTGDVTWSEDSKTATIALESKIREGSYTVTLGGLEDDQVGTAEASFEAEDETVESIEFVTSSDTIAKSKQAKVRLRAENQYGELSSFSASYFTVNALDLNDGLRKDDEGYLVVTLDTSDPNLLTNVSVVPIYVYFDDNRVTAQKTFTIGTEPFVSGLELGDVEYAEEQESLSAPGDTAEVALTLFDQYGNPVTPDQVDEDGLNVNISHYITPYNTEIELDDKVDEAEDQYIVQVSVDDNGKIEKNETLSLTIYAGSASASTDVAVSVGNVAMDVRVGDVDSVLASGDTDRKYITLHVTGPDGEELTPQEIVDNVERIRVSASGGLTLADFTVDVGDSKTVDTSIVQYGVNKGKVRVEEVTGAADSYAFVTAQIITPNTNSHDNRQFKIDDARHVDSVVITDHPHEKMVLNSNSDIEIEVQDQYGDDISSHQSDYRVEVTMSVTAATYGDTMGTTVTPQDGTANATISAANDENNAVVYGRGAAADYDFAAFNEGFTFNNVNGDVGEAILTATLYKWDPADGGSYKEVDKTTAQTEAIKNDARLYYSLESLGDMYAAIDSELIDDVDLVGTVWDVAGSAVNKEVKLVVKDASGDEVAYPNSIVSVTSGASTIAQVEVNGSQAFVLGNKAGTTNVTVIVDAADGTTKSLTTPVTVKADLVQLESGEAEEEAPLTGANGAEVSAHIDLKVKDQYGVEYENTEIYEYDELLGLRYTISDITDDGALNQVSLNETPNGFEFVIGADVTSFVINAVNRQGEVVASTVILD